VSATAPASLQTLVQEIQRTLDGALPEDIPDAVRNTLQQSASLSILPVDVSLQGRAEGYTRHVLYAHPAGLYTMVALVWRPGQMTPIHGHYTWCSYVVLQGAMHEDHFMWQRDRKCAVKTGQTARCPGDAFASHAGMEDIHRLCNTGNDIAISIHVYGVDQARVCTHVNRIARELDTDGEPDAGMTASARHGPL